MNVRACNIPAAYRCAVAGRAATAVLVVAAILFVGYTAPVERVMAGEPEADTAAETFDNGPTGYFPDMFRAQEAAAESVEHIEAF
jgi:hypothetical protein